MDMDKQINCITRKLALIKEYKEEKNISIIYHIILAINADLFELYACAKEEFKAEGL